MKSRKEIDIPSYVLSPDIIKDTVDYEANSREPWKMYRGDFGFFHYYYNATRPYRIWYEYLHLSPTFSLARKYLKNDGLLPEELKKCPKDFYTKVLPTCKDMQLEIGHGNFDLWWLRYGADIFGKRTLEPNIKNIMTVANRLPIEPDTIIDPFKSFLNKERLDNGNDGFMVFALPLSISKKQALKDFGLLLDEAEALRAQATELKTYKLHGVKVHSDPLPKNLLALWTKAINPDLELWRIGLILDKEEGAYTWLNPDIKKHTAETKLETENLASKTSNKIKAALITMENAARGVFPCSKDRDLPEIDKELLLKEVSKKILYRTKMYNINQREHQKRIKSKSKTIV